MALSQKRRKHACDQQQHQPWRKQHDRYRECEGGDSLLHQTPNRLNHHQAVSSLDPRSFQPVIKNGILVGNQIEARRVVHHSDAHVPGVFVSQQGIRIIDGTDENAVYHREGKLRYYQPPESTRNRLVRGNSMHDAINDQLCDPEKHHGQQRRQKP